MDYIMGIDVGTSNVKAVLFDEKGTEIQVASRVSETINDGGNNEEQDMTIVWEKVKACITELMDLKVVAAEDIKGIGVTGQGEGCWLIDKEGKPLQNAILWCDGRAVAEVHKITEEHPEIGKLYHRTTGTPPLLGNQMMLLRWMKSHRKDVLDKGIRYYSVKTGSVII